MATKSRTLKTPVARAIARVKKAQAAYDAAEAAHDDAAADDLSKAESDACGELEKTPCANDEEFLEKLKYLVAREVHLFGSPFESFAEFVSVARAAALHFGEA